MLELWKETGKQMWKWSCGTLVSWLNFVFVCEKGLSKRSWFKKHSPTIFFSSKGLLKDIRKKCELLTLILYLYSSHFWEINAVHAFLFISFYFPLLPWIYCPLINLIFFSEPCPESYCFFLLLHPVLLPVLSPLNFVLLFKFWNNLKFGEKFLVQ